MRTTRGSVFSLCRRARDEPERFPRYPRIPVLQCPGWQQGDRPARAASFASVAEEYERGRPGYPPEAIEWLLGAAPLDVVDLGAGTGKLTAALVAAGHRVTAVEPLAEMRAQLATRLGGVRIVTATAEETTLPDYSFDAVVAGAAFHWFDRARVFDEISRLLRAPGVLGLLGNGFDDDGTRWAARLREIIGSSRLGRRGHWPDPEELRAHFTSVDDGEFRHTEIVDRSRLRDLSLSRSSVAMLSESEREPILALLDALWDTEPELRGRDSAPLGYVTRVRRCRGVHR